MEVATAIMVLTIAVTSTAFIVLVISGIKEKEKDVTGFSRIDRSVGAKLELMVSILRKLLLTPSALIIVLTLAVSLAGMAVLSDESRSQSAFAVPFIKVESNLTVIKLVNVVSLNEVLSTIESLVSNTTGMYALEGVYLVKVVDKPIRVEGVRIPKLVVVGVDDCCDGVYLISCETHDSPDPPFVCVDEDELRRYLYADSALPVLPIEAFIGNRPVFPPLTSVIVASLKDASRLLGYEEPVANVVLIRDHVPPSYVRKLLGNLVSEVWAVSEKGTIIMTSEPVSSLKEVMLAVFLSIAMAVVVSSAARSMTPRVEEVANKLMISGFPSWGGAIIYYVVVMLCSIIAITVYSGVAIIIGLSTSVGHLILVGAFVLTTLAHIPRTTSFVGADRAKEDYLSARIDGCVINAFLEYMIAAIKRTEFFIVEELTIKRDDDKAFVRSKSIFSETWGIGVDIEVLISSVDKASCRVEVWANDWSIEEISASLTKSVRSLALSRIRSVIELWRLGYSHSP